MLDKLFSRGLPSTGVNILPNKRKIQGFKNRGEDSENKMEKREKKRWKRGKNVKKEKYKGKIKNTEGKQSEAR